MVVVMGLALRMAQRSFQDAIGSGKDVPMLMAAHAASALIR